jgi:hypothetical protein
MTARAARHYTSVGDGAIDGINHEHLDGPLGRLQLEPELFLECRKSEGALGSTGGSSTPGGSGRRGSAVLNIPPATLEGRRTLTVLDETVWGALGYIPAASHLKGYTR